MKRILLASTALVAMAGAASAEITFSGSATLGYNDTNHTSPADYSYSPTATSDNNYGFYWDASVTVTLSQTLDNGITAGASFDFTAASSNTGTTLASGDYVVFLKSDNASLYFGDTSTAAAMHWKSAGDMEADSFTTDWADAGNASAVIRGDISYSGVNASVSYIYDTGDRKLHQLSIGADGTVGQFSFALAYQADANSWSASTGDYHADEIFGISGSTTFSGATVTVAYAKDNTSGSQSTGIKLAYPIGPVTATAYYVDESTGSANYGLNLAYASGPVKVTLDYQNDQGTNKTALDGSYDVGNGLVVYAGYYAQDSWDSSYYLGGKYDLGGGASVLMSYADGGSDGDSYGAPGYQQGATVEVNFSF